MPRPADIGAFIVVFVPSVSLAQVITVDGTDAIFLAGRTDLTIPQAGMPWPGGLLRPGGSTPEGLQETLPPIFQIVPGSTVEVVTPATGLVSFTQGFGQGEINADGDGVTSLANIGSFGGISGFFGRFAGLVGVFLTDDIPDSSPPPTLDFSDAGLGADFTSIAPDIGQIFRIGDGQTADGVLQRFIAPANATRFAIGVPDAFAGRGGPGYYNDNDGSYQIELVMEIIPAPMTATPLLCLGGLFAGRRR